MTKNDSAVLSEEFEEVGVWKCGARIRIGALYGDYVHEDQAEVVKA